MTYTKGNIIVEEINVGDIHYQYDMGLGIKWEVLTKPTLDDGCWVWKSKIISNGQERMFTVDPKYTQFSANLYDYPAYKVNVMI